MKNVVLAYSGGLDTSVAVTWLKREYGCDVHCVAVDVGQDEDLEAIGNRALANGAASVTIEDARAEFVEDFVFEMLQGHPNYEAHYLLGSAISRPIISKRLAEVADRLSADAIAHGATGKGNDQFRFELSLAALGCELPVIAPWRSWEFRSRADLVGYANTHNIALETGASNEKPLSMDRNLIHTSYEGELLEDPAALAPTHLFDRISEVSNAPDDGQSVTIAFEKGNPVSIDGTILSPVEIMQRLNEIGSKHGVGRVDHVESRFLGMKSRNIYETPGLSILYTAHRAAEAMCLDKEVLLLKEELMPRYARQIYDGLWYAPERQFLQAALNASRISVNATVSLLICKGGVTVQSRSSESSLYDITLSSIEEDREYDHDQATGFINLAAVRLRQLRSSNSASSKVPVR